MSSEAGKVVRPGATISSAILQFAIFLVATLTIPESMGCHEGPVQLQTSRSVRRKHANRQVEVLNQLAEVPSRMRNRSQQFLRLQTVRILFGTEVHRPTR